MELPDSMHAMIFYGIGQRLVYTSLPMPVPKAGQVLIKVIACGVCRTDLHIVDGELTQPKLPLIPGHEIVGIVVRKGEAVSLLNIGEKVGVPWMAHTCGDCKYCRSNKENLCEKADFTGYTVDGGYATYTVACEQFCFPLAEQYANASGAPLMCAGLIGYRSYRMIPREAKKIGIYGFGAAAHILAQVALFEGKELYAFTTPGDITTQDFARTLGVVWAGDSLQDPPERLDAAIIFASYGPLVPKALGDIDKGGIVVCGGIHMSDIPAFPYSRLWGERSIRSVANLSRSDGKQFLMLAPKVPVHTAVQLFTLQQANEALDALRSGRIQGAAVLVMPS